MSFWSRLVGSRALSKGEPPGPAAPDEDLLVISDIHLGEDVLASGPEHLGGHIRVLNKELTEFVLAHRRDVPPGRRWHLVINGDMFDFVKVSLRREADDAPDGAFVAWSAGAAPPSDDELAHLPNTPANVVWKLGRILEIHRPLFKELARFLLDGHRVTVIEGNHDAEFYFPEVQERLRAFVVAEAERAHRELHHDARTPPPFPQATVAEALQFRRWFLASGGRYHIEHGHQYDELCSFEYNLAPVDHGSERGGSRGGQVLATPMTHRVMPYFVDLLGDFSTHGIDSWGARQWFGLAFNYGPRMLWIFAKVYVGAMWDLMREAGPQRRQGMSPAAAPQRSQLESLARESQYGVPTLEGLERLRAVPAEYSLAKMMHVFYLDRFVVILGAALGAALGALVGGEGGALLALSSLGLGGLGIAVLGRRGRADVAESLRRAAAHIADHTGARYVVFGHSHHPELVSLRARYGVGRYGEACFYLNSGSWVTREILRGEEGRGMTFVEISAEGAFLKRWAGSARPPLVLARTGVSAPGDHEAAEDQQPHTAA